MNKIPSFSPLQFKGHSFPLVYLRANENGKANGEIGMDQDVSFLPIPNEPDHWNLQLRLKFYSANANEPFFYEAEIIAIGVVVIIGEIAPEKRELVASVNGLGILYSACREMLLNMSARSVYGPFSIPSINFTQVLKEAKERQSAPSPAQAQPLAAEVK